jgi:glycosyltransferase involved in cell wall biosynthesis
MNVHVPKVSIGMPVYNGGAYLRRAIETLLNQSFTDFELIICDNGSTDGTQELCREFAEKDSRVRFFVNEKNLGAWGNHNRTFELARGQYFKWAADDDEHTLDYLEKTVRVLDSEPDVVCVQGTTRLIDSDGTEITVEDELRGYKYDRAGNLLVLRPPQKWDRALDSDNPAHRFRDAVLHVGYANEVFGLCRRDVFARTDLQGPYYGSDKVIVVQLACMGKIKILPEKMFLFRRHPDQSASITNAAQRESWNDPQQKQTQKKKRASRIYPRWMCFKGYWRGLRMAKMTPWQRMYSFGVLGVYALQPQRWWNLTKEALGLRPRAAALRAPSGAQTSGA